MGVSVALSPKLPFRIAKFKGNPFKLTRGPLLRLLPTHHHGGGSRAPERAGQRCRGCSSTELCASHPSTPSGVFTRSHGAPPRSAPFSTTRTEVPTTSGATCRLPPAGGLRSYPGSLLPAGALTTGLKRPAFDRSLMCSCTILTVADDLSGAATGVSVCCSTGRGAADFAPLAVPAGGAALPKLRTVGPGAGAMSRRRPSPLDGALLQSAVVVDSTELPSLAPRSPLLLHVLAVP